MTSGRSGQAQAQSLGLSAGISYLPFSAPSKCPTTEAHPRPGGISTPIPNSWFVYLFTFTPEPPPASVSQVLDLQLSISTPGFFFFFKEIILMNVFTYLCVAGSCRGVQAGLQLLGRSGPPERLACQEPPPCAFPHGGACSSPWAPGSEASLRVSPQRVLPDSFPPEADIWDPPRGHLCSNVTRFTYEAAEGQRGRSESHSCCGDERGTHP